jgi:hypothetical protein
MICIVPEPIIDLFLVKCLLFTLPITAIYTATIGFDFNPKLDDKYLPVNSQHSSFNSQVSTASRFSSVNLG